jgi:hypothetical protein
VSRVPTKFGSLNNSTTLRAFIKASYSDIFTLLTTAIKIGLAASISSPVPMVIPDFLRVRFITFASYDLSFFASFK